MEVLVACEMSGEVRDAFLARGHIAVSCDLQPSEKGDPHYQGDVRDILYQGWDLLIAHPPCTYLCNSGVKHLYEGSSTAEMRGAVRWKELDDAIRFFKLLQDAPIKHIALENPIPHRFAREHTGDYTQIIQPWQFGHGETKATCLWLKNLPPLKPTKIVSGRYARTHLAPPGPERAKERSRTYQGVAEAMAHQWGDYVAQLSALA